MPDWEKYAFTRFRKKWWVGLPTDAWRPRFLHQNNELICNDGIPRLKESQGGRKEGFTIEKAKLNVLRYGKHWWGIKDRQGTDRDIRPYCGRKETGNIQRALFNRNANELTR